MADPGKGPGGLTSALLLDETEAPSSEKHFFLETGPPSSDGLDPPAHCKCRLFKTKPNLGRGLRSHWASRSLSKWVILKNVSCPYHSLIKLGKINLDQGKF